MKRRIATLAFSAACTLAAAAEGPPIFNFKLGEPPIGSNIRPPVLRGDSRIPLNRTYAELSAEEKAIVRDRYEAMPVADEPPYPADGLLPIFQAIAQGNRELGGRGQLTLVATVGSAGAVEQIQLLGDGIPGMNQLVAQVLMVTRFKPAVCGGQPCKMDFPFRLAIGR